MTWTIVVLFYLLIGLIFFVWVIRDDRSKYSWFLMTLIAPVIMLSYPYLLLKRVIR